MSHVQDYFSPQGESGRPGEIVDANRPDAHHSDMAKSKKQPESKPSKTTQKKLIRIACEGAGTVAVDDLIPLQGNLKTLSEEAYQRLRLSILNLGFSFPVFVWKQAKKMFVIDAHQRLTAVKRMRDEEGYVIPPLPAVWVEAASREEAARKLLAATAQFGEITGQGLYDFMQEFKIDMPTLETQLQFPEIDFPKFRESFFNLPTETMVTFKAKTKGSTELNQSDFDKFDHECPKCKYQW